MRTAIVAATVGVLVARAAVIPSLDVFFAPFDAVSDLTTEVMVAANVTAARRACPTPYFEPAANPFTIRYSVYNLELSPAIQAMIDAHKANVKVQVLVEYSQLFPNKTWNFVVQNFTAANMSIVADDQDCIPYGAIDCSQVNLVGVRARGVQFMGLMHTKMRLFHYPDPACYTPTAGGECVNHTALLTGSLNPDNAALLNDETLIVFKDDRIAYDEYDAIYKRILSQTPDEHVNAYNPAKTTNVIFSKGVGSTVTETMFRWLAAEKELVFIFVYSLRDLVDNGYAPTANASMLGSHLVDQLAAAQARGASVVVMTDQGEVYGEPGFAPPDQSMTAQRIAALGIPVYVCNNTAGPFNAFHHKNGLFGLTSMFILTDTANWSEAAMGSQFLNTTFNNWTHVLPANDETSMLIDSRKRDNNLTGLRFLSAGLKLLRAYESQNVPRGQPSADEILQTLVMQRGAAWPRVSFTASASLSVAPWSTSYNATFTGVVLRFTRDGAEAQLPMEPLTQPAANATQWRLPTPLSLPWCQRLQASYVAALLANGEVLPLSVPTHFDADPANRTLEYAGLASLPGKSVELHVIA